MNTAAIPPIQLKVTPTRTASARYQPPPQSRPAPESASDTVQLSTGALGKSISGVPDAVLAAVTDLQGEQTDMRTDFRTIGDYFAQSGGREALDAFMRSNFTDEQLRAFPPPVDGLRQDPALRDLPDSVTAALADLKGDRTTASSAAAGSDSVHGGNKAG